MPQAYFDGTSTGELLTRLTVDVSRLSTAVADNLGQRGVRSLFEVSNAAFTGSRCAHGTCQRSWHAKYLRTQQVSFVALRPSHRQE
jgi:hypothetical protein